MLISRLFLAVVLAIGLVRGALADQPMIYASNGAAIDGYDAVAYFTSHSAVKGQPSHKVMWTGAVWYFVTSQNREAFEANPRAYAPKFGGYCAYSVSQGRTAASDPQAWRIEGGRLYLNHNRQVRDVWLKDVEGNIRRANANWPAVLSKQ